MYKDKDKQRKAVREATRRYRANKQGITSRVSPMDRTVTPMIPEVAIIARQEAIAMPTQVKAQPQSHTPMMVGYVPPKE